ncbi:hypothetical protein Glove_41g126 [Diversispora epigaea]|uniref:Uncharacterized protein n=1 Tax=Diversispora epigaea TaxID=1348612 RepID=A0A397JR71_9GLOM|nr:hypothetical protein Glove_41g126 [Diversispora epigaea]
MPAHISTICYIESRTENTSPNNFIVNAVGVINSKDQEDKTYLQITAFYSLDENKPCDLSKFELNDVIQVEGRFLITENDETEENNLIKANITDNNYVKKHKNEYKTVRERQSIKGTWEDLNMKPGEYQTRNEKGLIDDILGSEDDILGSEFFICYINRQFGEEDLEDCGKYWNFYWDDILGSEMDDILGSEDDILGSEFSICYINCQFGEEDLEDCGKYWDFYWDDILGSEFSICYTNCQFGEEDLEDCGKYWDFEVSVFYLFNTNGSI